ncbi:MAG: hypothetical protein HYV97_18555 [Bdellovibrio sp.]|nr:hypothetical protein [Bdellovibrio sp.]
MKFTVTLILLGALASCATRMRIMEAAAVSMTESSLGRGEILQEIGPVEDKFCPSASKDQGQHIGLMDEAIRSAQSKSGADFITNATFFMELNGCVVVNGTAIKKASKR